MSDADFHSNTGELQDMDVLTSKIQMAGFGAPLRSIPTGTMSMAKASGDIAALNAYSLTPFKVSPSS